MKQFLSLGLKSVIPFRRTPNRNLFFPRRQSLVRFISKLVKRHADTTAVLDIWLVLFVVDFGWGRLV